MLTYLSLFSGAGIGCHGLDAEGFTCVATAEILPRRLEIQRFNGKCKLESGYISDDISLASTHAKLHEEMKKWGIDSPCDLDFLIATPPCQGMSVCNHKKRDEMPRNSLIVSAIRLVAEFRPKIFLFENTALFLKTPCTIASGQDMPIGEAINSSLGDAYHITARRINLKNYGCPSSRTRTLVVGTAKHLWFSPLSIFPDWTPEVTLRDVIGDLPPLTEFGEIDKNDIYHSFKPYSAHMRKWISGLREGQGAFDQRALSKRPHRIVDGKRVENKNANGDKYRRQHWDACPPCVHTRNDILSSQNTLHPSDDRVFSVREIMCMLSVPQTFKWSNKTAGELSALPMEEKTNFLRANEMNIRHSLGEAVPPAVIQNIAKKAKSCLIERPNFRKIHRELTSNALAQKVLQNGASSVASQYSTESLMCNLELLNEKRKSHAAFYTPPSVAFHLLQMWPDLRAKKSIRILEPSAGIGRILLLLPNLLAEYDEVIIDAIDIDNNAIEIAKALATQTAVPNKVKINYLHGDFLDFGFVGDRYDVVIGNPPFGKMFKKEYQRHVSSGLGCGSRNMFGLFLHRALALSRHVVMIAPKSFLSAPDFGGLRAEINAKHSVKAICDFGERGFDGVRIETIALAIESGRSQQPHDIVDVVSVPLNRKLTQKASDVFDGGLPYWVIYRDKSFNETLNAMQCGVFDAFRDRQICKRHFSKTGKVRILKARNIGPVRVRMTDNDFFLPEPSMFAASQFINRRDVLLTPNLAIYPRACWMPQDCIADGSVAVLRPRNGLRKITDSDVRFFSSPKFHDFYRVARNHGTRSLNVDSNSAFFFGVRR